MEQMEKFEVTLTAEFDPEKLEFWVTADGKPVARLGLTFETMDWSPSDWQVFKRPIHPKN